jgi:YrbI family 3-deoxy-D-manno-octulosonate 8-phosphate phosphatase
VNRSRGRPSGRIGDFFTDPVRLVVFDFDGVFTDNGVWIGEGGEEFVRCDRSDGLGLAMLRDSEIPALVLSTETNPVVSARCLKLRIPVEQGIVDKGRRLREILTERSIDPSEVVYVGNDVNDASCLQMAGVAVVVHDAHPDVLALADVVLTRSGGHGAVREMCDLLLARQSVEFRTGDQPIGSFVRGDP